MFVLGDLEEKIKIVESQINEAMTRSIRKGPIYIAFDEWNVWYRTHGSRESKLEDALVVAQFLNLFVRNAHIIKMANMAQLVNVIAPLRITDDELIYQPIYYPLSLFANNCFGESIDLFVDCDTYDAGNNKGVPYLDVSAAYNKTNSELILNVVNRHLTENIKTDIISNYGDFSGDAEISVVNGKDIKGINTLAEKSVGITTKSTKASGTEFSFSFPAHSYTMIKVKMKTK